MTRTKRTSLQPDCQMAMKYATCFVQTFAAVCGLAMSIRDRPTTHGCHWSGGAKSMQTASGSTFLSSSMDGSQIQRPPNRPSEPCHRRRENPDFQSGASGKLIVACRSVFSRHSCHSSSRSRASSAVFFTAHPTSSAAETTRLRQTSPRTARSCTFCIGITLIHRNATTMAIAPMPLFMSDRLLVAMLLGRPAGGCDTN